MYESELMADYRENEWALQPIQKSEACANNEEKGFRKDPLLTPMGEMKHITGSRWAMKTEVVVDTNGNGDREAWIRSLQSREISVCTHFPSSIDSWRKMLPALYSMTIAQVCSSAYPLCQLHCPGGEHETSYLKRVIRSITVLEIDRICRSQD